MALRVIIVGPGRVGSACGKRLAEAGAELVGYVGRDDSTAAAAAAVAFAGAGEALAPADHRRAHVVLFAVGDAELRGAIERMLAAAAPRSCSLWMHTSGCHGLEVLDGAVARGARRGALHPVAPFADAESGYRCMAGQPAVVVGDDNSRHLLGVLCKRLAMVEVVAEGGDRALYHAACALAANGTVALRGLVDAALAAAAGLSPGASRRIADALMGTALASAGSIGAGRALSGPVLRGDAATVALHLQALARGAPAATPSYRALMRAALALAIERGLPAAAAAAMATLLDEEAREP